MGIDDLLGSAPFLSRRALVFIGDWMVRKPASIREHSGLVDLVPTIPKSYKLVRRAEPKGTEDRLAEARQQQLVASYQYTILSAYADVESALVEVANTAAAEDHLRREVEAAREAFQISQLQYRQRTTDLLTVLQAQQTLFSARDQLAQATFANRQAAVHLYESLGGGWLESREDRTQFAR